MFSSLAPPRLVENARYKSRHFHMRAGRDLCIDPCLASYFITHGQHDLLFYLACALYQSATMPQSAGMLVRSVRCLATIRRGTIPDAVTMSWITYNTISTHRASPRSTYNRDDYTQDAEQHHLGL